MNKTFTRYSLTVFLGMLLTVVSQAQDTARVSLLFAGDVMGHDSQIAAALEKNGYDYEPCFRFVKPYIEAADLAIANLEVTLAGPPFKGYPQFSSPDALPVTLKEIGFDALVTANNHSVDRGRKGIERTIKVLDSLNIPHTGTFMGQTDRLNNYPLMLSKNGFSIALLNYTYGTNGIPVPSPVIVNPIDTTLIHSDILRTKELKPDVIIAFVHWGVEYENLPRKNQKDLGDFMFQNGVDLVIGAHPHVLQPMEWRKADDKLIVYSLGNFVSGQRKRYTDGGAMAYVELQKVRYKPDSIVTTIDSAGYVLQWVYRSEDAKKDYYILPVPSFEKDTANFIKGQVSRDAFKVFAADSRNLYGKNNLNVPEIKGIPIDTVAQYNVMVPMPGYTGDAIPTDVANLIDPFYGMTLLTNDQTNDHRSADPVLVLGPIANRAKAEALQGKFVAAGKQAAIVKSR